MFSCSLICLSVCLSGPPFVKKEEHGSGKQTKKIVQQHSSFQDEHKEQGSDYTDVVSKCFLKIYLSISNMFLKIVQHYHVTLVKC